MEQLPKGITLLVPPRVFPLSTDSMLLAHFVKLPKNAKALDLGSSCGTLGALLCAKEATCAVTGIEIDPIAHEAALENIRRNNLESRLFSICADLRAVPQTLASGSFHLCLSNPPYYTGGPSAKKTPHARKSDLCELKDIFSSAAWALRWGGDFYMVHKPEMLGQLCGCALSQGLEPKRLCLVRHKPDKPVSLLLLQCRKGGKPGLKIEEVSLFTAQGEPGEFYRKAYHL